MLHFKKIMILIAFGAVAALAAPRLGSAEETTSYTVSIDVAKAVPLSCSAAMSATGLAVALGTFTDTVTDRKVAELKKGDTLFPVYLDRPIADLVKDGVRASLEKCGYKVSDTGVLLSGQVSEFSVESQKKLVTSKGNGAVGVELKLASPDGRYRTFKLVASNDEKGLRKKGVKQVEAQLAATYKAFLAQFIGLSDFRSSVESLAKGDPKSWEGASTYPAEKEF